MLESFALALAVFVCSLSLHFVVTHVAHSRAYVRNAFITFGVVSLCALPVVIPLGFVSFVFIYLCATILWNSYLIFFINLQNSVSLRMIAEIDRANGKSLTLEEMLVVYPDEIQLQTRLDALQLNGMVSRQSDGALQLTMKGTALARNLARLRTLIGIETYG